jgi:hypothetical protein
MTNLNETLKAMLDSVEKTAADRREKIEVLEKELEQFWEKIGNPALKKLAEAIRHLHGRDADLETYYLRDPTRSLTVLDRDHNEREFIFHLKITRDDLKLFIEFDDDEKKYPLEEITEERIYELFIEQYETALKERLVPE